jgi:hypothetical protein
MEVALNGLVQGLPHKMVQCNIFIVAEELQQVCNLPGLERRYKFFVALKVAKLPA